MSDAATIARRRGVWPSPAELDLLRAGLGEQAAAQEAWERWSGAGRRMTAAGVERRLLPLAEWNLRRPAEPLLSSWAEREALSDAAAGVLQRLGRATGRVIVIKGFALALLAYPHPALRPMGDVDLLVRPEEFDAAARSLEEAGWRPTTSEPRSRLAHLHGLAFAGPGPREVDLHRHALAESCAPGADDGFFARSVPFSAGAARAWTLSPADHLLCVCVHGLRWSAVAPVQWIADAVLLLRATGPALDWDVLLREACSRDLARPVASALRLIRSEFGAPVPPEVASALSRMARGWRRRLETGARMRPPSLLRGIFLHWCGLRRERRGLSLPARIRVFPAYLRELWGLDRVEEVPAELLRKVRGRLRRRAA